MSFHVSIFICFASYSSSWDNGHHLFKRKDLFHFCASSVSVQASPPGHKSVRFEKEQGEYHSFLADQSTLFTGVQIMFQQSGEAGYLSSHNWILYSKARKPNPKLCFLCILPLWTSWLIDYTVFNHLTLFSHLSSNKKITANIVHLNIVFWCGYSKTNPLNI